MVACVPLPFNLHLKAWEELIQSAKDARVVECLCFSFPVGYDRPVPTPTSAKHSSAINHARDVDTYVATEVKEGAMLGPFHAPPPPFTPWCQFNALLTCLKKGSHPHSVIMDLSWPHPSAISVNGFTPKESYLGKLKKMHVL